MGENEWHERNNFIITLKTFWRSCSWEFFYLRTLTRLFLFP